METIMKTKKKKKIDWKSQIILILIIIAVLSPFYIMLLTSVETFAETNQAEFVFVPETITFEAYKDVISWNLRVKHLCLVCLWLH